MVDEEKKLEEMVGCWSALVALKSWWLGEGKCHRGGVSIRQAQDLMKTQRGSEVARYLHLDIAESTVGMRNTRCCMVQEVPGVGNGL